MITVAGMSEWLASFMEIVRTRGVREGFLVGLTIGFLLPVSVLVIYKLVRRRRRRCREIALEGQNGELHISVNAVREFVRRIVSEFSEADMKSVSLRSSGSRKEINIVLNVVPGTDLVGLQNTLSERVKAEAARKLGLDENLGKVNVWVHDYSADEEKIARRASKVKPEAELGRGQSDMPEGAPAFAEPDPERDETP